MAFLIVFTAVVITWFNPPLQSVLVRAHNIEALCIRCAPVRKRHRGAECIAVAVHLGV